MTQTVSPEIAKLLKDNWFPQILDVGITCRIGNKINSIYEQTRPIKKSDIYNQWCVFNETYPPIEDVVMWLYETHGVWIYSKPVLDEDGEWMFKSYVKLMNNFKAKEYQTSLARDVNNTYESAIKYVLNNIIK